MIKSTFKTEEKFDIIKSNNNIRDLLLWRFTTQDISFKDVCKDALSFGLQIEPSALSKYLKHRTQAKGTLSHDQILFLLVRWGLSLKLDVKVLTFNNKLMRKNAEKYLLRIIKRNEFYEQEGYKLDRGGSYPERFDII